MKSLVNYIKESKQPKDIFKGIDPRDFEWQSAYSDNDYQRKCRNEVKDLADDLYSDLKPIDRIVQLFKDSYMQYLETDQSWSPKKREDEYNEKIKMIDKHGWGQFESYSLEQGWWAFMYWAKRKMK